MSSKGMALDRLTMIQMATHPWAAQTGLDGFFGNNKKSTHTQDGVGSSVEWSLELGGEWK